MHSWSSILSTVALLSLGACCGSEGVLTPRFHTQQASLSFDGAPVLLREDPSGRPLPDECVVSPTGGFSYEHDDPASTQLALACDAAMSGGMESLELALPDVRDPAVMPGPRLETTLELRSPGVVAIGACIVGIPATYAMTVEQPTEASWQTTVKLDVAGMAYPGRTNGSGEPCTIPLRALSLDLTILQTPEDYEQTAPDCL